MRIYAEHFDPETVHVADENPADEFDSRTYFQHGDQHYLAVFNPDLQGVTGNTTWFELYEVVNTTQGEGFKWGYVHIYTAGPEIAAAYWQELTERGLTSLVKVLKADKWLD